MNKRAVVFIILFIIAASGIYLLFRRDFTSGPKLGAFAPEFTLKDSKQQEVPLASLRGKVVLLNFWATWCGPCQEEMPSLEALYQRYKDKGFVVLGVSLDEEGWPAIEDFTKRIPVNFPILLDAQQATSDLYQVYRIPETYLIDSSGKIVDKFVGPQDYDKEIFYKKVERYLPGK